MNQIYDILNNKIIDELDKGIIPWKNENISLFYNPVSDIYYSGINAVILSMTHFKDNNFLTFDQCKERNGKIKKGEKATQLVFLKRINSSTIKDLKDMYVYSFYNVFNLDQCEGINLEERKEKAEDIEKILKKNDIEIKESKAKIYYDPKKDVIKMPSLVYFQNEDLYYENLIHELIHWTGHEARLDRFKIDEVKEFDKNTYDMEEMIADIATSMLLSKLNKKSQIKGDTKKWKELIKKDSKVLFTSSKMGQKAVNYLLNS